MWLIAVIRCYVVWITLTESIHTVRSRRDSNPRRCGQRRYLPGVFQARASSAPKIQPGVSHGLAALSLPGSLLLRSFSPARGFPRTLAGAEGFSPSELRRSPWSSATSGPNQNRLLSEQNRPLKRHRSGEFTFTVFNENTPEADSQQAVGIKTKNSLTWENRVTFFNVYKLVYAIKNYIYGRLHIWNYMYLYIKKSKKLLWKRWKTNFT